MSKLFVLITTFFLVVYSVQAFTIRGGGHEKYKYYMTEGWLESDHAGSGFHITDDYTKPNLWIRVFRYDTAVSQVIGIPNNEAAGAHAFWDNSLDQSNPPMRGGDYYKLLQLVDFNQETATIDSNGDCSSSGRCYGDWLNNELLWDSETKDYIGNGGVSFLKLEDKMQGQKRTRYRFDIFIEDNTPFWYKDEDGNYDMAKVPTGGGYHVSAAQTESIIDEENRLFYPIEQAVFRIVEKSKMQPLPAEDASQTAWNSYFEDKSWSEYHVHKDEDALEVVESELQIRRVNGRLVFNFSVFHAFQKKSDYVIQVIAEDHSGNRRALQASLSIERLKGLELRDQASDGQRFRD
tara:strand:- start:3413 stop:4459 length:1047 start_codon:yes stop_codon:yes gene_type:complete